MPTSATPHRRRQPRHAINIAETARRLADLDSLWRPLIDFDPVSRYYAQLASEREFEAWLLTWLPGQGTEWHDHGDSAGSYIVLQGRLTEAVARPDTLPGGARHEFTHTLEPGDQRSFGRTYIHRVTNEGPDPAVSLHVYSPKLTAMNSYSPSIRGLALATRVH